MLNRTHGLAGPGGSMGPPRTTSFLARGSELHRQTSAPPAAVQPPTGHYKRWQRMKCYSLQKRWCSEERLQEERGGVKAQEK